MITTAHLLAEIVRTAKTNGGVPLGRHRFYTETGIKDTDRIGKYWARWGTRLRSGAGGWSFNAAGVRPSGRALASSWSSRTQHGHSPVCVDSGPPFAESPSGTRSRSD